MALKRRSPVHGLVLAAMLGTWAGHSLEYLRVWGTGRFPDALSRSAHTYVGRVGLLLVGLGVVGLVGSLRLARRLERRLADLRAAAAGAGSFDRRSIDGWSGWEPSWLTLVGVLWTVQLGLYLVQENFEARAFGLAAPGLGAVTGVHAFAPLVHLVVAGCAASVVWLVRNGVRQLVEAVRQAEARLAYRNDRRPQARWARSARAGTPLQRWGAQRWARPPPLAA